MAQAWRDTQEAKATHDHRDHEHAKKLYALVDDVKICMMTTQDAQGGLRSRPMYCHEADESGDLWFYTSLGEGKVEEIADDSHVNLAFAHPSSQNYVSISGRAEIVRNRPVVEGKWSEWMRAWFPKGKDDPNMVLIRVHPERGEYWDSPSSTVINLYGYAKAAMTGKQPTELSENAKVNLT